MLILSNGAPKSATTLLFYFTKQLLGVKPDSDVMLRINELMSSGLLNGSGSFLKSIDRKGLDHLLDVIGSEETAVLKIHARYSSEVADYVRNGKIKMTYGYRDPRDMILSGMDHQKRQSDRADLMAFSSFESAAKVAKSWARHSLEWKDVDHVFSYQYEDLVASPYEVIRKLANYLGVDLSHERALEILEKENSIRQQGTREFNTGRRFRYTKEMSADDLNLCAEILGQEIKSLGYDIDLTGSGRQLFDIYSSTGIALHQFHDPETYQGLKFRWSLPMAAIKFRCNPTNHACTLDTGTLRGKVRRLNFRLFINSQELPSGHILLEGGLIHFFIPKSAMKPDGIQTLSMSVKPVKTGLHDQRSLGLPCVSLTICEESSEAHWREAQSATKKATKPALQLRRKLPLPKIWLGEAEDVLSNSINNSMALCGEKVERWVVSHTEVNSSHGTGILLQYIFGTFREVGLLITGSHYGGQCIAARHNIDLSQVDLISRPTVYKWIAGCFGENSPKQAYIVPYNEKDFLCAIALHDVHGTDVCIHLMDDNCLLNNSVPKTVVQEALEKCKLVLAISGPMLEAYTDEFGIRAHLMPPLIPDDWVGYADKQHETNKAGHPPIILGTFWSPQWLESLKPLLRNSGVKVDWFCNNKALARTPQAISDLKENHIVLNPAADDASLLLELSKRPYAIISTSMDEACELYRISKFSLPSRAILMLASAHLPILVTGCKSSAIAKFVTKHDVGMVIDYCPDQLRDAHKQLMNEETNLRYRNNAKKIAGAFSLNRAEEWIWESTSKRRPIDGRFEDL